jgi:hypothetical protein
MRGREGPSEFGLAHGGAFSFDRMGNGFGVGFSELWSAQPTTGSKPPMLASWLMQRGNSTWRICSPRLAKGYDEVSDDVEAGAAEIGHAELLL